VAKFCFVVIALQSKSHLDLFVKGKVYLFFTMVKVAVGLYGFSSFHGGYGSILPSAGMVRAKTVVYRVELFY